MSNTKFIIDIQISHDNAPIDNEKPQTILGLWSYLIIPWQEGQPVP